MATVEATHAPEEPKKLADHIEEPSPATEKPNDAVAHDKPAVAEPPHGGEEKALVPANVPEVEPKKASKGSLDRDVALAKLEDDKRLSFIKAWEDSEKSKVDNKAQKKLADVLSWENSKKAALEAQLRTIEEKLEKKKAEYAEKMKNKVALIHKQAEEKKAMVEAQRGEQLLKADELAAKYRATGHAPKKGLGCLGC